MLYDYVQCPHRVTMDQFGDPTLKDPISPFVRLLWEKGVEYENEVVGSLEIPFENLHPYSGEERVSVTRCGGGNSKFGPKFQILTNQHLHGTILVRQFYTS